MSKDKKDKKEPAPIDKIKERQELIESAYDEMLAMIVDFVGERGLSSAEAFAVVSRIMYVLSETAMQQEHEEYFGPESEQQEE